MKTAREIILREIEIDRKIYLLKRFNFERPTGIDFGTSEYYNLESKAEKAHLEKVSKEIDILEYSKCNILHELRTLPLEEAEILLNAFIYRCDGDQGYGSWPNPDIEF